MCTHVVCVECVPRGDHLFVRSLSWITLVRWTMTEREREREEWSDLVLVSILAPSFVVGSCLDRLSLFCSSAEVISFPSRGGRFPI